VATAGQWRIAYAKQARADLQAREVLARDVKVPACQHLHFLQMACEKICKAYLCGMGTDPGALQKSHAYISKPLPAIIREQLVRRRSAQPRWVLEAIRALARRIELLAPSVDAAGTIPANCEYPWEGRSGMVHVPAEHNFAIDLSREPAGRHLLKALYSLLDELLPEPAS